MTQAPSRRRGDDLWVFCRSWGTIRMFRRGLAVLSAAALLAIASPGQQATSLAYASSSLDASAYAAPAAPDLRASVVTTYAGGSTVVEHSLYARTLGLQTS